MSDRADDGARERARPLLADLTMQYDSLDQDAGEMADDFKRSGLSDFHLCPGGATIMVRR